MTLTLRYKYEIDKYGNSCVICENSCSTDDKLKKESLSHQNIGLTQKANTHNMRKDRTHKTETFYRRKH